MTGTETMLLLADEPFASQLTRRLDEGSFVRCGDPYEVLLNSSRRTWKSIVLTGPRADFDGLCKAVRRLQTDARLFGLCPPAAEPQMRHLVGETLDDYFIFPPSADEVRILAGTAPPNSSASHLPQPALDARDFAQLIEAAHTPRDLEARIVSLMEEKFDLSVSWTNAEDAPPARMPLLLAAGDVPRVLLAGKPSAQLAAAREFLDALQQCLPALMDSARRTESLHKLAITDHLTGAYNRRYFYHATDRIVQQAHPKSFRAALLLFDIDDFKRFNDTHGHSVGDEILRELAGLIKRTTRAQDIVARIGGDEFAILFWDNAAPRQVDSQLPETAFVMAERFRTAVSRHEFPCLGPEAEGPLTISGGLATFPSGGKSCRELLRTADAGLREVKQAGKNAIKLIGS